MFVEVAMLVSSLVGQYRFDFKRKRRVKRKMVRRNA